jgi:twitching motility protein PilJ
MVASLGYYLVQANYDKQYVTNAGEQRVLSQRIAKYALEAAAGNQRAFSLLKEDRDRFQKTVDTLKGTDPESSLPATEGDAAELLAKVDQGWIGFRKNINTILEGESAILNVRENAASVNELMRKVTRDYDEAVGIMTDAGISSDQVFKASQLMMLNQRVSNNVNKVLVGGEGTVQAADRMAKDADYLQASVNAMLEGDKARGISKVRDSDARDILGGIASLLKTVRGKVNAISERSDVLINVQDAAGNVTKNSDALIDSSTKLMDSYSAAADGRISPYIGIIFGIAVVVLMINLGVRLVQDSNARTRAAEEKEDRNQESIMRLLEEISGLEDGDLTVNAVVTEDFTGAIADAFNSSIEELRKLVTTINETSVQVSSAAQETQATAMHLAEASDHQAQQITAASSAVNEMAVSIEEVSRNAAESADVSQHSVEIAKTGAETVRRTIHGMDTIREQIQETSKRIKRLGESSQEIGDIVELINDIADQTNILSLNAAIQAAMAGEAGRGFAVVADEVQRLAERSGNATKQIEALVKTIQTDTNEAVISMEQSTAGVVSGAKLAEDAGEALGEIENVSNRLADLIEAISSNAGQQSNAAANISDTMNVIQEITTQTSAGTNETAASIGNLADLANDLRKSVSGFKTS